MNRKTLIVLTAVLSAMVVILVFVDPSAADPPAAFQGAYGAGAGASGGRGGDVYHVTNLNDNGWGSLRYGIDMATGPRTIVFDTAGTIHLNTTLNINKSDLTIAGQTAPGGGITLADEKVTIQSNNNMIMRYLRFRLGDVHQTGADSLQIYNASGSMSNIMIDHISASWGIDETLSVTGNTTNVTVQNSIISEGLHDSYAPNGPHSCGSLLRTSVDSYLTFHHNLYAHHHDRSPYAGSYNYTVNHLDWRNNVTYNWGGWAAGNGTKEEEEYLDMNLVGNYYIVGPSTDENPAAFRAGSLRDRFWQSGNKIDTDLDDEFDGIDPGWDIIAVGVPPNEYTQMPQEFNYAYVPTDTADEALLKVLATAGASLYRDAVDQRVVQDVYNNTGAIIDSQTEVGGWPSLPSGTAPLDTDQDGMPDYWEDQYGLNKYAALDRNDVDLSSVGYTNLEVYLDYMAGVPVPEPGSLVLLGTLLVGLSAYVWRKRSWK